MFKPIKFHGGLLDKQVASVTDLSHWQPRLMRADYQGTGTDVTQGLTQGLTANQHQA